MNTQSNLYREISAEAIRDIFVSALQEDIIWDTALMDGGLFNTTYLVEYGSSHKKAVLRLGPVNRHLVMGFEENLMDAEVYAYSLCHAAGIPCSHVLACDTSRQVIDRDFMIVEYIPSIVMAKAELTEERREHLHRQMGIYLARFHQVTGEHFGFLSRVCKGKLFEKWSDALIFEVEDITGRLEQSGALAREDAKRLRNLYYESRELLDEIKTPHFLHTDLWSGNVLLDPDTLEIAAIIDSDRAMFGDIAFEFASPWLEIPALKEGHDSVLPKISLPGDARRRQLYQMFYYIWEIHVGYSEYNDTGLYEARKRQLLDCISCF